VLKDDSRFFTEKAELIYEFDNSSPLFIRKAEKEIQLNNLEDACHTLQQGVNLYPDYPTAHVLLGRAFSLLGNYAEAKKHYGFAAELIDSETSYRSFLAELESYKKMRSPFTVSKRATHVEEHVDFHAESEEEPKLISDTDELAELARKISKAKIAVVEEDEPLLTGSGNGNNDEPLIISETLARIYASQSRYAEAISVYRLLAVKFPHRKQEFETIVRDLESKVSS
jgi:tetratricopeptide (TPR) repeat protein